MDFIDKYVSNATFKQKCWLKFWYCRHWIEEKWWQLKVRIRSKYGQIN